MRNACLRQWVLVLFLGVSLNGSAQVENGGFEKVSELRKDDPICTALRDQEWTCDDPVRMPDGWALNIAGRRKETYRVIRDSSVAHSGEVCVYLTTYLVGKSIPVSAGDVVTFSFWVKDHYCPVIS